MRPDWIAGLAAAAAALAATPVVRAFAWRRGIVNAPNPIVPQHVRPVAYLGGLAVAVATFAGLGMAALAGAPAAAPGLLVAAALALALGLVDDLRPLRPASKLGLQALAAALMAALGARARIFESALPDGLVSVLWIVVLANAANLTDVCDGLVAGLSAIALVALATLAPEQAPAALAGAGACVGFLAFNRPPASIFLGDAGSHFLGFWLAGASFAVMNALGPLRGGAASLAVLAVPLFELVFLTIVRASKGLPFWRGSPDHFSLRLQARGFSRPRTVAISWLAGTVVAGAGLAIARLERPAGLLVLLVVAFAGAITGRMLWPWEVASPGTQRAERAEASQRVDRLA